MFYQSHKKRSSDKKNFYHFCTHFFKIGGVLFWQRENFSSKISWFYNKNHIEVLSVDLKCHFLYIVTKIYLEIWIFNMIWGLNMTRPHTTKIPKWLHILVIPLVGSPKPRTKSKNSPTHTGTEKREAKVVILGDFRGGLRVLIRSFQTWACGYEEI